MAVGTGKAEDAAPQSRPPVVPAVEPADAKESLRTYRIPIASVYSVQDLEEAKRRWELTKQPMTVDVFELREPDGRKILVPLAKLKTLQGITSEPGSNALEIKFQASDAEDRKIRQALEKGGVFVSHYHWGW